MNTDDKKIAVMQRGGMSDILLQQFGERIREKNARMLAALKTKFRSGETDQITLACGLAACCALDDLEQELKRDVISANRMTKEIHDSAQSSN